ncbi:MAG TPA: hypothetical protein VMT16_14965 [Thermoanaerobaculia bacterium]|nr:hypothetical protein [Thermoanaerobaculia bacterium]
MGPAQRAFSAAALEKVFFALLLIVSTWLMFHSFAVTDHVMLIGSKVWSDFAATLPLIRSFSMGDNWPPEYPLYPGEPIRYHFLFFALVGALEKLGLPLDWALNLPSILGFFVTLLMLYLISTAVLRDRRVGVLAVLFALCNGSLSFVEYFSTHGWTPRSVAALWDLAHFPSFGPFDGSEILGVWNLNVYINQRHFGVALALLLGFVWFSLRDYDRPVERQLQWGVLFGCLAGLLPLFHKPVLLVLAVCLAVYFFLVPRLRTFFLTMGASSLAVMLLLSLSPLDIGPGATPAGVRWAPGFLVQGGLTAENFLRFWWLNWGLHVVWIPVALWLMRDKFLAPRSARVLAIPALLVFAIGCTLQFSAEITANHKFFNAAFLLLAPLSAYTLVRIFDIGAGLRRSGRLAVWTAGGLLLLATVAGGIVDLMPIKNDAAYQVPDLPVHPEARWFAENTAADAVVLNSHFLYHPASIAGRHVFLGWPYFTWSAGYDVEARRAVMAEMYSGRDANRMCALLAEHRIGAVTVEDTNSPDMVPINVGFFDARYTPDLVSAGGRLRIYHVSTLCPPGGGAP